MSAHPWGELDTDIPEPGREGDCGLGVEGEAEPLPQDDKEQGEREYGS